MKDDITGTFKTYLLLEISHVAGTGHVVLAFYLSIINMSMFCWKPSNMRDVLSQYFGNYLLFESWKCFSIQEIHLELGEGDLRTGGN